jgi:hypothetical protein
MREEKTAHLYHWHLLENCEDSDCMGLKPWLAPLGWEPIVEKLRAGDPGVVGLRGGMDWGNPAEEGGAPGGPGAPAPTGPMAEAPGGCWPIVLLPIPICSICTANEGPFQVGV